MSDTLKCAHCECAQTRRADNRCRRCGKVLPTGRIESTTVLVVSGPPKSATNHKPLWALIEAAVLAAFGQANSVQGTARLLNISRWQAGKILGGIKDSSANRGVELLRLNSSWTPIKKRSQQIWLMKRKARGLCIRCGSKLDGQSQRNCEACLGKQRNYRKAKKFEEKA